MGGRMFRTRVEMVERLAVWSLIAVGGAAFWIGVLWVALNHPGWFVRAFVGLGMLACCTSFWRASDSRAARVVSAVLAVLVGYVAFSVLGVW